MQLPQAMDRVFAKALSTRHGAATPMGHPFGLGLQRRVNNSIPPLLIVARLTAAPGCHLPNPLDALGACPLSPEFDGVAIDRQPRRHLLVGVAVTGTQENTTAQDDLLRCGMRGFPAFETA